jgi:alanine racemase
LCDLGINHFSVFSAQEAFELQKHITNADIMIMGDIPSEALEWVIENEIEFVVFNTSRLLEIIHISNKTNKKAKVHIEIETGMNRTGINPETIDEVIQILQSNSDSIELTGLCTHLAGAEHIVNHIRVKSQIKVFKETVNYFEVNRLNPKYRHCACSASAVRYPSTCLDFVRIGILTYGFWPSQEILIDHLKKKDEFLNPLKRVIKWKSTVMAIKNVKSGEYIGYGSSFKATRDMSLAVIPVGYETGFSRSLSNKGSVLIGGEFAYIVGTVNMNAVTVNVTHIQNVKIGDEVVLIGRQGDNEITVAAFSDLNEQLNYELLTRLPIDIPREITE